MADARSHTRSLATLKEKSEIYVWYLFLGASRVEAFAGAAPFTASRVVHRGAGPVRHWVRWGDTIAISQPLSYYYRINYFFFGRFKGGRRFSRWVPRARIPIKRSLRHLARHRKRSQLLRCGTRSISGCRDQLHRRADWVDFLIAARQLGDFGAKAGLEVLGVCSHKMWSLSFDRAWHWNTFTDRKIYTVQSLFVGIHGPISA